MTETCRRRYYVSGTGFAFWRWNDVVLNNELYLRRLHVIKVPYVGAIMLHWIKLADPQSDMHDHPVSFLSIVLKGWYEELTPDGTRFVKWWNFKRATDRHRITIVPETGATTLVLSGPKTREWGFFTPSGWKHWKEYNQHAHS